MNTNKIRAATVGIAPVLLAAALLWHPPIPGGLPDHVAVAEHVAHDPTRWGLAHFAAAAASAFLILGFVAIRAHLRDALDPWISAAGLGLVVIGSTAYAVLPGMEFAVLAAHEIGADPVAAQVAIRSWFMAVLLTGGALFAVGVLGYAAAIGRVGAFSRRKRGSWSGRSLCWPSRGWCRLVPCSSLSKPAAPVALWPMAWAMWTGRGLDDRSKGASLTTAQASASADGGSPPGRTT
jgi:hypothetical protein